MKEVTYEDWQKNPTPRVMWVWEDSEKEKRKLKVIYFIENKSVLHPIVALSYDGTIPVGLKHCAEIETQRRMTHKELSWWLSEKPHREWKATVGSAVHSTCIYNEKRENEEVDEDIVIREDDGEWREPLVEEEE